MSKQYVNENSQPKKTKRKKKNSSLHGDRDIKRMERPIFDT